MQVPHLVHRCRLPLTGGKPSFFVGASPWRRPAPGRVDLVRGVPPHITVVKKHSREAEHLLGGLDTLIFDCDGVLWRGSTIIPRAPDALKALRKQGKRLLFVTNNSSKSRSGYVDKFASLGLNVEAKEIVSSSFAAAAYLRSIGFTKRVLLIGPQGVREELEEAGLTYIDSTQLDLPLYTTTDSMLDTKVDPDIGAVLVGWDPYFSYSKMVYASICLREVSGCVLVATNTDHADKINDVRMMPGTGGLVAAIEVASGTRAVDVGKGGPWLLPFLCGHFSLDPSRTCIVGDRLDTDIALGRAGGLVTILPLTGVTTTDDLSRAREDQVPDYVISSIADLI